MPSTYPVVSVTEVNQLVQHLLQECCDTVTVEGEISNFHAHRSGHWYFTLKDDRAQIRVSMFARANQRVPTRPQDGELVQVTGQLSLYAARGDFQLIAESLQPVGEGALQAQQQVLLKKIHQLGWSDEAHKQPLPQYPAHIGIITAPGSAAMHDILVTIANRWPCAKVSLFPTLVQGPTSITPLKKAIQQADQAHCDVLILARGGGSLEDLWSFNDWGVIECVFQSKTPLITGIGHETDVTLVDAISDARAPTPTGAAVLATPDAQALKAHVSQIRQQYQLRWRHVINQSRLALKASQQALSDAIHEHWDVAREAYLEAHQDSCQSIQSHLTQARLHLKHQLIQLDANSPLKVLSRGYCAVSTPSGEPISQVQQVSPGDALLLTFQDGQVHAKAHHITDNQ